MSWEWGAAAVTAVCAVILATVASMQTTAATSRIYARETLALNAALPYAAKQAAAMMAADVGAVAAVQTQYQAKSAYFSGYSATGGSYSVTNPKPLPACGSSNAQGFVCADTITWVAQYTGSTNATTGGSATKAISPGGGGAQTFANENNAVDPSGIPTAPEVEYLITATLHSPSGAQLISSHGTAIYLLIDAPPWVQIDGLEISNADVSGTAPNNLIGQCDVNNCAGTGQNNQGNDWHGVNGATPTNTLVKVNSLCKDPNTDPTVANKCEPPGATGTPTPMPINSYGVVTTDTGRNNPNGWIP